MGNEPERNYETLIDSFLPHEIARPVDRSDKEMTYEEYAEIQEFYQKKCKAAKKYTE